MRLLAFILLCWSVQAQEFIPYFESQTGNYLLNNVVAYWTLNETSGNASDSSSNARTLTQNGSPGSDTGMVSTGRTFSSTTHGDYFSRTTESAFAFGGNAFTITAWASFNARSLDPNDMTVIGRGDITGSNFSWWLFLDHGSPNDSMYFVYSTDGTFDLGNSITFPISGEIGTGFNFIAVRWDGTTLRISVTHNSESALEADQTKALSGTLYAGTPTLRVGEVEGSTAHDMGGTLDEIGVWSRSISDCELEWLFTAKAGSFTYANFNVLPCEAP